MINRMLGATIFATPELDQADLRVLEALERQRRELSRYAGYKPRRWIDHLRSMSLARAIRGSNWIEGYRASLDDVRDAIEGEEPIKVPTETRAALSGYRDAMTFILSLSEAGKDVDESLLSSLHFMMTKHDLRASPGTYRRGEVWVEDETGARLYEAPDANLVEDLMAELVRTVNSNDGTPVTVRAAMAHLNLVMIHPFRDGNGRMARALQTMVLAREGIVSPIFASVEEYLGRNTDDYYAILSQVGQGTWHPGSSARPWIRFMLTAHYRQAWTVQRRVHETEHLYDAVNQLTTRTGLPPRSVGALVDAASGRRLRRGNYINLVKLTTGDPISDLTASRDLKRLVDAGVLRPQGAGRGRLYYGSADLRRLWHDVRATRPSRAEDDPYATLA